MAFRERADGTDNRLEKLIDIAQDFSILEESLAREGSFEEE
jgi:hypothetical protein